MSYKLVNAVFDIKLPRAEHQVLMYLCKCAHNDGTNARPAVKTIALRTQMSERTAQAALRALEAREYIRDESGKKGGSKNVVNYTILIPNADIVAKIESLWKGAKVAPLDASVASGHITDDSTKGAMVAPIDDEGCDGCTDNGAMVSEKGAMVSAKGAMVAPESVLNLSSNRSINRSDFQKRLTDRFTSLTGKAFGTADFFFDRAKQHGEERVLAIVEAFAKDPAHNFADTTRPIVRFPSYLLTKQWNEYEAVVVAQEADAAERARLEQLARECNDPDSPMNVEMRRKAKEQADEMEERARASGY